MGLILCAWFSELSCFLTEGKISGQFVWIWPESPKVWKHLHTVDLCNEVSLNTFAIPGQMQAWKEIWMRNGDGKMPALDVSHHCDKKHLTPWTRVSKEQGTWDGSLFQWISKLYYNVPRLKTKEKQNKTNKESDLGWKGTGEYLKPRISKGLLLLYCPFSVKLARQLQKEGYPIPTRLRP